MALPVKTSDAPYQGIPKSPRALFRFIGTSLLAGMICAMLGGGIALFMGLSPIITGSVSGFTAAVIVAVVILRYGQTD